MFPPRVPDILASRGALCRRSLSFSPRSLALRLSAVAVVACCRTADWMSELNFHCTTVVPTRDIVFVPLFPGAVHLLSRVLLSWFARFSFTVSGIMLSLSLFVPVIAYILRAHLFTISLCCFSIFSRFYSRCILALCNVYREIADYNCHWDTAFCILWLRSYVP